MNQPNGTKKIAQKRKTNTRSDTMQAYDSSSSHSWLIDHGWRPIPAAVAGVGLAFAN